MKRYFEVRPKFKGSSSGSIMQDPLEAQQSSEPQLVIPSNYANEREKNIELETLIADPGRRKPISDYHPDIQNEVRKAYLKKGPNQPRNFTFSWTKYGDKRRRFNVNWFNKYDWLEYSESADRAYCLSCYLFKNVSKYGGDHFVGLGFDDWNNPSRMGSHASATNGSHNDCVHMGHDLMNPNQSIVASLVKQTHKKNIDYKVRVGTSLLDTKYLLRYGSPFRGHDESEDSPYRGPFLETINLLKESNQDIAKALNCAPGNNYMTSPVIQKDLAAACAFEITKKIVSDIGDDVFGVLIDESGDCSGKEKMAVVVRYVNSAGFVMERFLGIIHIKETSANSLKEALQNILSLHRLSLSSVLGQGYDGASNMRGRYGELRTLIQNENPCAYYVHCFAHQLQLALVACAKSHTGVSGFFGMVNMLVNLIRSSNKRMELLRGKQKIHYANLIEEGSIVTGSGLNQESSIVRAGDTRWGSHFRTLTTLMTLYSPILGVLEEVGDDSSFDRHGEAIFLLDLLQSFDFIFMLYFMVEILGISHDLNVALQR
ncbi:hypothetical protein OROHE_007925 [Orobanche hederae]